ncbi:PTS lactose/cellobiose transporter subunit IIA [Enterococcus sp. LJL99]
MVQEKVVQDAMKIILHAGDARKYCMEALKSVEAGDFDRAAEKMELANTEIVQAHHIQTDAITAETLGAQGEYSVLFAHAQDTLMTIYSEINIVKRLLAIFNRYEERIQRLEVKLESREENE